MSSASETVASKDAGRARPDAYLANLEKARAQEAEATTARSNGEAVIFFGAAILYEHAAINAREGKLSESTPHYAAKKAQEMLRGTA